MIKVSVLLSIITCIPVRLLNLTNFFSSILNSFWGNKFHVDPKSPPWDFPLDTLPIRHNISSPPTSQSSAVENFPSIRAGKHNNKGMSSAGIACTVGGVALIATCAALFTAIRISRARILRRKSLESCDSTLHSQPISTVRGEGSNTAMLVLFITSLIISLIVLSFPLLVVEYSSTAPEDSPQILAATSPFYLGPRRMPPVRTLRTETTCRRSFSTTYKLPPIAKLYTVAELQSATNNFSEEKLLGQGSLGYVYKAEFPDGQVYTCFYDLP